MTVYQNNEQELVFPTLGIVVEPNAVFDAPDGLDFPAASSKAVPDVVAITPEVIPDVIPEVTPDVTPDSEPTDATAPEETPTEGTN